MRCDPAGRLTGEIICYWDYGDFLDADAAPLIAAWDYVESTGDRDWARGRIEHLERVANFLAGRISRDGLVEAIQPGTRDALQEPNRSDAWWDALNCGHKDGYTNALIYRAWRSLAELESSSGEARRRRLHAPRRPSQGGPCQGPLRSEAGWLAWWRSATASSTTMPRRR